MAEELVLDTAIRDWVLIPLSVVMVLIGVLRYFVTKLMRSPPSASPSPDPKTVKEGCVLPPSLPNSVPIWSRSGSRNYLGRLCLSERFDNGSGLAAVVC